MQLVVNITYGIPIGVGLWLIGVPNPILWGMLATVLRFVPYIGPIIAAFFPLALAIAVDPGWTTFLWTGALFIVIELISNNVIEPWLYGSSTGLSPVAIIAAAIFWTWLWGPIGLLLSTPLTVCLVVLGRHVPQLAFLDVLLRQRAGAHARRNASTSGCSSATRTRRRSAPRSILREHSLDGLLRRGGDRRRWRWPRTTARAARSTRSGAPAWRKAPCCCIDNLAEHEDVAPAGTEPDADAADDPATRGRGRAAAISATTGSVLCVGARGNLDEARLRHAGAAPGAARRAGPRSSRAESLQSAGCSELDLERACRWSCSPT